MDELIELVSHALDSLANTPKGHKITDDLAAVIGRFYKNLVVEQGLPPHVAAAICAKVGSSSTLRS